jgi:hypothetical protein
MGEELLPAGISKGRRSHRWENLMRQDDDDISVWRGEVETSHVRSGCKNVNRLKEAVNCTDH